MSRYIDADALIENFGKLTVELWLDSVEEAEIVSLIGNSPSIDIEPKRGEWVKRKSEELWATVDFAYCSECKQPIIHKHLSPLWNFCPNCGADMRGKGDD